jgi:hypothetical protein
MPSAAPTLLKIMRSGIEGAPAQEQLQFDSKPPRPYIPMNLKGQLTVLDLHPEEVARQITLIDQGLYRQIRPREFLGNGWSKSDKEVRSPGIIQMINNFNKVYMWCSGRFLHALLPNAVIDSDFSVGLYGDFEPDRRQE